MKKVGVFLAIVLISIIAMTMPASAGWTWCSTDPVIQLPDGGVVHLTVSVPDGYQEEPWTLDVWAPVGSKYLGDSGKVTIVLHESNAPDKIKAKVSVEFPVQLSAKYEEEELGTYTFKNGHGVATWSW
jgi:hypothetical protein